MLVFVKNLQRIIENSEISVEFLCNNIDVSIDELNQILDGQKVPLPSQILKLSEAVGVGVQRLLTVDGVSSKKFLCKLLVLDIDGVMTDGGMYVCSDKTEIKKFDTKDGLGIKRAIKKGLEVGIISSGRNFDLVNYRAEMLDIKRVYVGTNPKLPVLESWCEEMNITLANVAYIGDDINDLDILKKVGFSACPSDSVVDIKNVCVKILKNKGGKGCVRELIEYLNLI